MQLDDKQRELLRDAMQKNTDEVRALDEKLRAAQKEVVKATLAEKFEEKVVREKLDAVAKIQTDISMLRAKAFSPIAPTLKPEQREQLENCTIKAPSAGFVIYSSSLDRGRPTVRRPVPDATNYRRSMYCR